MVSSSLLLAMRHCKRKKQKLLQTSSALCNKKSPQGPSLTKTSLILEIKSEQNDYNEMCRICLKDGSIPIFGSTDISEDLNTFTSIEVKHEDEFPKYLCESCNALLQGAILLRKTAQQSDQILRQTFPASHFLVDNDTDHFDDAVGTTETLNFSGEQAAVSSDEQEKLKVQLVQPHLEHMIKVERVENKYDCQKCEVHFDTFEKYEEHILSAEHDNPRRECPVCHKNYNLKYLRRHLILHGSGTSECQICDVCGKKFFLTGALNRHRMTHFLDKLPFKCSLCPYRGRFSESLKSHMICHTGERAYPCPQCPLKCRSKSNLNKHMLTHKNNDYNFLCSQCSKGFFIRRDLDNHVKVDHYGIKDFVCNICGKAFGYQKQMRKHQLKVHKRDKLRCGRTPLYVLMESKQQGESTEVNSTHEQESQPAS